MPPSTVLLILEFYRRALQRLDQRIRTMLLSYARAEDRILAETLSAMATEKSLTLRDRRRRSALTKDILRAVDSTARIAVPEIMNQSFQIGTRIAEIGTEQKVRGLSQTNRDAMKLLTENLIEDLGEATSFVGRRVDDVFRREALRASIPNIPGERPPGIAAQDLLGSLEKQGIGAFRDRAGRLWTLKNYAEMATITVSQEAINVSQLNILTDRGIDLVQINKVRDPCPEICAEFNGETFSLTGRAEGYPILKKRPPFHGRCRHIVFPSPLAMQERRESGWTPVPTQEQVTA